MASGLEGVVATTTRLSDVDGERGRLTIVGYPVEELAEHATFEDVACLLLRGRLPDRAAAAAFARDLAARRALAPATLAAVREAAGAGAHPMAALRMAAATLGIGGAEEPESDAMTVIAALPAIVGAYWRLKRGEAPVPVR